MKSINNCEKNSLFDLLYKDNYIYKTFDNNFFISNTFACVCDYNNDLKIISMTNNFNNTIFQMNNIQNLISFNQLLDNKECDYLINYINRTLKQNKTSFCTDLQLKFKTSHTENFICCGYFIFNEENQNLIELTLMSTENFKNNEYDFQKCKAIIESKSFVILDGILKNGNILSTSFISNNISFYNFNINNILKNDVNLRSVIYKDDIASLLDTINDCNCKEKTFTQILRLVNTSGKIYWVIVKGFITIEKNSTTFLHLYFNSIDEQAKFIQQFSQKQKHLSENLKQSNLITDILKLLQVTDGFEDSIRVILKKLSIYANLSSAVFYIPDTSCVQNNMIVYSYNKSNNKFAISRTSLNNLTSEYPAIFQRLKNYGTVFCDSCGVSEGCKEEFLKNEINSCLIYTIYLNTMQNAYLCCIDKNNKRCWNNKLISVISDVSQVFTGMLHSYFISNQLSNTKNTLTKVLDNIDVYVFASELSTDKIIYSNKKFINTFGNNAIGKHFIDVVNVEFTRCLNNNNNSNNNKPKYYEIYCPTTNQWLDVTEANIKWHDGQIVKLLTMTDITQKVNYEKLIENQAFTDHLTSLPNRRMLEHDFPIILEEAEKADGFGYILFLDLDNFKNVNDGLGHPYGDALLIKISQFLLSMKYIANSCYRFGGDEFVILINYENAHRINDIINTLLEEFQQKWKIINTEYYCTASIGVAKFPYDGYTLFDLMKKVDMAMYSSKKLGKNRFTHYKSKIGSESIRNIELERYFRESVNNNFEGFKVFYQPIINAKTKQIEGAEALLRWSSEDIGNISPNEFIPLTESIGLIVPVGDFVLNEAIKKCKEIINMGYPNFKMYINLSVLQLIENNIVERIKNIIKNIGVPFKNIGLEVTESLAINDMEKMKDVLNKLSNLGIKISLDDFGTGYSSLNYIKQLPLNTIKIDKSFIDDLDNNNGTELFVNAIIDIAHGLKMKVCAEGVETQSQYTKLLQLKTDVIQGYYFGKPMPSDEFDKKYNKIMT